MSSTKQIGIILLGSLMLSPLLALAEETAVTGEAGATVTHEVKSPRDTASGMASGKRLAASTTLPAGMEVRNKMMASGTKPLPTGMENRMENRDAMRDKMQERASTSREKMEERKGEMKQKMEERRGQMLKRHATMFINRTKAAIERLVKLSDRMDSRIVKMKEHGADTTKAEANMVIARAKIADARAAVALAEAAVASAVASADADVAASSSTPVDAGKSVREALNKAKDAVFAAHKALVEAIVSLKGIKVDTRATTTTSVGTTTP